MLLFPLTMILGLSIGRLRRGRFRNLASIRFRRPGIVVAALALQAGMGPLDAGTPARWLALVGSYALIGLWLAGNLGDRPTWFRVGIGCVAIGYGLNVAAIVPNGDMPVSAAALRRRGARSARCTRLRTSTSTSRPTTPAGGPGSVTSYRSPACGSWSASATWPCWAAS